MAKFKNHIARILEKQNRLGGLGFQGFYDAPQFQAASTMAGLHLQPEECRSAGFELN
jgi:hypothetical protein